MAHHDLESLLAPLADEAPSGPDLEYDPEFQALDRAATPKAERAIGDSVKTAEEPDWDKVSSLGESLLGRSKDLRTAVHLTSAWTRMHGLAGWSDGLALIRGLLENHWDTVHPQLDAEDDNDPTARVNAVMPLVDMQGVLGYFRSTPFVQSPRLGRFSLRDLRIANGTLKTSAPEGDAALPSMTDIEACCLDCPEEQLAGAAQAATAAMEHARAIDAVFTDRWRIGNRASLSDLMPSMRRGGVAAVSEVGVLGDPTTATAADGERILADMVDDCVRRIGRWAPGADGMLT